MKVLVGTLNNEKAIVGAFSGYCEISCVIDESYGTGPLQLNVCEGGQLYSWRE